MKALLLSFIVLYVINTGGINGKIIDKKTSEELAGVMVVINNQDTTYTDFDGNFKFNDIDTLISIDLRYPSYSKDDLVLLGVKDNLILAKK